MSAELDSFVTAPLDLVGPSPGPKISMIQFSDRPAYEIFMARNKRLAHLREYQYLRRSKRVLEAHPVYFEKVRMALDAFEDGAEWVLWVDDDATINAVGQTAAEWIDRFRTAHFIIAREVSATRQTTNGMPGFTWPSLRSNLVATAAAASAGAIDIFVHGMVGRAENTHVTAECPDKPLDASDP